jgi:DNA adenine methylase
MERAAIDIQKRPFLERGAIMELLLKEGQDLFPPIKWPGGKGEELKHLLPFFPRMKRYFEPFLGGGAAFFALGARESLINDRSHELIQFYQMIAQHDPGFFAALDVLVRGWQDMSTLADGHMSNLVEIYSSFSDGTSERRLKDQIQAFLQSQQPAFCALWAPLFEEDGSLARELQRNLFSKMQRMRKLERERGQLPAGDRSANIEAALKSALYMRARSLYNQARPGQTAPGLSSALFFFVRENAYASMFRYNSRGEFNVPYAGISYNRKNLAAKIAYLCSSALRQRLNDAIIGNSDFEAFLERYCPQAEDFLFLDLPYWSEFRTYARHAFTWRDQERLAEYLLTRCPARFLLVIKSTPEILALYDRQDLYIRKFEKTYQVSFQGRNDRAAEHLVITNYKTD